MPKVARKKHVYTLAEFERCLVVCERYMLNHASNCLPPHEVIRAWENLCNTPPESEFLTMKLCQRAIAMAQFFTDVQELDTYSIANMEYAVSNATDAELSSFVGFAEYKRKILEDALGTFYAVCFRMYKTHRRNGELQSETRKNLAGEHVKLYLRGDAVDEVGELFEMKHIKDEVKLGTLSQLAVSSITEIVLNDPGEPPNRKREYECTRLLYGATECDDSFLGPLSGLSMEGIAKVAVWLANE